MPAIPLFMGGCIKEDHRSVSVDNGDEVEVVISMNVPRTAETRALTETDENTINTLDVLVFLDNGAGQDETFLYATHATDFAPNGATTTVKVGLQKSNASDKHRLVFLANLRNEVTAVKDSWTQAMTKEQVLQSVTFDAYDAAETLESNRAWDTSQPEQQYLPMWGESEGTYVVTSTIMGSTIGTIKMLRSVATVNIVLNPDSQGDPQGFGGLFELKDIKVYNVPQKGYAAPDPDYLTSMVAGLPTYSSTFTRNASTVVAYETNQTLQEDIYGFTKQIYLPEAPNTDGDPVNPANIDDLDQTCLVISGYYDGSPKETWYRIDFIDKLSGTENIRWDILRNHRYTFYVTSVDGPGYDDEDEAFRSAPLNLDTEILVWDEGNQMPDIEFDGQYHISVSADSLYFYQEGREQVLTIKTNHPDGWGISYTSETNGWVTATPDAAPVGWVADEKSEVKISCDAMTNPLEIDREGYIIIKAGKLKKYIKIYQINDPELTISVSPTTLTFYKSAPAPKSVTVTVYPADSRVYFTESPGANPIASWFSFPASGSQYVTQYDFQPDPNNTNDILSSFITVYTQDASGMVVSQSVTILQHATDMLLIPSNTGPYGYPAGNYFFTVDAPGPWQVTGSTPAGEVSNYDITTVYTAKNSPVTYNFDLTANNSWAQRSITFQTASPDPDFAPQDIIVTQDYRAPEISINTTSLDLGSTDAGTSGSVTVTSNAKWRYTTAGDWSKVVGSATVNPGTDGGSHTYSATGDNTVTFSPATYSAGSGTPAAGTYTGTAVFTTTDHAPATAASTGTLTVSRTVPAYFTPSATTLTAARAGGTLSVGANTNAFWSATPAANGTGTGVQTASDWGGKTANITIAENTEWTTGTTPVNRTITVNTAYGATSALGTAGTAITVSQPGNYISGGTSGLSSLTAYAATSVAVSLTGAFPTLTNYIRAYDVTNSTAIATGTIAAQEGTTGTVNISVPANTTWSSRQVKMQYRHPGYPTETWLDLGSTVTQAGYSMSYSAPSMTGAGRGFSVTVTGSGYGPEIQIRCAIDNVQIDGSVISVIPAGNSGSRTGIVQVPPNMTNIIRSVQVQYYHPATGAWSTIRTYSQETAVVLSTGRLVAAAELPQGLTWSECMGISTIYNSYAYFGTYGSDPTNRWYEPTELTGCGAYQEHEGDLKKWRLPTSAEVQEMRARWTELDWSTVVPPEPSKTDIERYRSAEELNANGHCGGCIYWGSGYNATNESLKTTPTVGYIRARCVREP